MGTVSVSLLRGGEKLTEDVTTQGGTVLLYKGSIVTKRNIEFFKAFFIDQVSVDGVDDEVNEKEEETQSESKTLPSPFWDAYGKLLKMIKIAFNNVIVSFPLLEIRQHLEGLIDQIDHYDLLTSKPNHVHHDDYLYHHSIQVSLTSYLLAKWVGIPQKDWIPVALGGLLHDIGHISNHLVREYDFNKELLKENIEHVNEGYKLLKDVTGLNEGAKLSILQHHEREDGSGIPQQLKKEQIHAYSKVIIVADIYHTLVQETSAPYFALEQLQKQSFGKIDPVIVQFLIKHSPKLYNGAVVKLDDGRIGKIVFYDPQNPTRPWIDVQGQIINLTQSRNHYIIDIIKK